MQQSGCATSSCVNSSPMAMWTPEASKTCGLSTWPATPSATSSPGSGSGATHCGARAGRTTDLRGRDPALANLSPRQAKAAGLMTSGICGPISTISSSSAALQSSLVSRYRARTASLGSTLFRLTWKQRATPSGRLIAAQRASVPRTSDSASTGSEKHWPTPRAEDAESSGARLGRGIADTLTAVSRLAAWATPCNRDHRTPNLRSFAERGGGKKGEQLNNQAVHSGPALTGSPAETASTARLNPGLSRWLMGLPVSWDMCAPGTAPGNSARSSRKTKRGAGPGDSADTGTPSARPRRSSGSGA